MPAPAANIFHPKNPPLVKKENGASDSSQSSQQPRKSRPSPKKVQDDDKESTPSHPQLPFKDYKLLSTEQSFWQYDIMKFDSRRPVDVTSWAAPVKLNRKELRRETSEDPVPGSQKAVAPMLGPDGKPVIGADGRIVQVDAEGKPIPSSTSLQNAAGGSSGTSTPNGAAKDKNRSKKFQKKTKQVFLVPEETRKLRREERYPWVFEDSSGRETWVSMMDDVTKKDTHAIFMPSTDNTFKFIPTHRWYKFQKKAQLAVPTLEEAEKIMARRLKNKDPERWLLRRTGQAPSASTSAVLRAGAEGRSVGSGGGSLVHSSSQSLGPGGRKLKAVDSGMRGLFEEDDEEGVDIQRRRERERGADGDMDELEFEEDFADDEEKMEPEGMEDEEAKEAEERLKREYRNANKTREGYIDEDEDEDEGEHLTGAGKAMKKLMRNHDKSGTYESDEDKNPYASSEEEEEEEEIIPTVTAMQEQHKRSDTTPSRSSSQPPAKQTTPKPSISSQRGQSPSVSTSRANSPLPTPAPFLGGHSVVAKRATSPKAPKLKIGGGSRASSPLAQSPLSRSESLPTVTNGPAQSSSGAGSPVAHISPTIPISAFNDSTGSATKRKADENGVNRNQQPKAKKRRAAGGQAPPGELRDEMLVEWLKNTSEPTTRDCIHYFQPCLTDETIKARFTEMVKRIAFVKQGTMILRNNYRDDSPKAEAPVATAVVSSAVS